MSLFCPLCGKETEGYAFNVAFNCYNFKCAHCKTKYFLLCLEVKDNA